MLNPAINMGEIQKIIVLKSGNKWNLKDRPQSWPLNLLLTNWLLFCQSQPQNAIVFFVRFFRTKKWKFRLLRLANPGPLFLPNGFQKATGGLCFAGLMANTASRRKNRLWFVRVWFLSKSILAKFDYVNQQYTGKAWTGRFAENLVALSLRSCLS